MTGYDCPVACRRLTPEPPGRVVLAALDGSRELVFAGVTVCRLPVEPLALRIEEVRAAGPAGRAILVLRSAAGDGAIEAAGWWVHEPRPGLFNDLHAPFQPGPGARLTALLLVSLLGVPGMRGVFRYWHALRTR